MGPNPIASARLSRSKMNYLQLEHRFCYSHLMLLIKLLGTSVVVLFVSLVFVLTFLHLRTQHSFLEQRFLTGHIPKPLPDGFYKGSFRASTPWLGKTFNRNTQTGVNLFQSKSGKSKAYPFTMYIGKSNVDLGLDVLKIDYNVPANSFWVRHILDEVVEVSPNHYLGKVELRVLPNISLAIAYFELAKN